MEDAPGLVIRDKEATNPKRKVAPRVTTEGHITSWHAAEVSTKLMKCFPSHRNKSL